MRERRRVVATVSGDDFRAIYDWCAKRDVERKPDSPDNLYDCRIGVIQVWTKPWNTKVNQRRSELRGMYRWESARGKRAERVIFLWKPGIDGYDKLMKHTAAEWDACWELDEAQAHFANLFEKATHRLLANVTSN